MLSQIPCLNKCEITLAAFVWPFPGVCFQMSPQIACMNPHWLHLILLHYNVFPIVSSLWEYFDLQGPWRKKSLYTLQADPEKSRDFMLKNPGILIDWKSRDPVRAWSWVEVIEKAPESEPRFGSTWAQFLYFPNPTIGLNFSRNSWDELGFLWSIHTFRDDQVKSNHLNSHPWVAAHILFPKVTWIFHILELNIFICENKVLVSRRDLVS